MSVSTTEPQPGQRAEPPPNTGDHASRARRARVAVLDLALRYATVLVLIALLIAATIIYDGFWETNNLKNILSQNAPIGIVAIGMTFVIISGSFDLSVGAVFAAGAVFYASVGDEWPLEIGIMATLLVGALAGVINGIVITRFRVNSFIATIGTGAVFSGVTYLYCNSSAVAVTTKGFDGLGLAEVGGLPWAGVILIAAFIVAGLVLSKSVYGRWIHAVGGNSEAARLSGIRVDLIRISALALVGLCAAFGGAILASQLGVGQPTLGGTTALDAFAIVVIGGTSVYGGEGAIWRTAVGLAIIAVMTNLFNAESLDAAHQNIAKGAILVLALGIDALARSRRA